METVSLVALNLLIACVVGLGLAAVYKLLTWLRANTVWTALAKVYETSLRPGPQAARGQTVSLTKRTEQGTLSGGTSEGSMICEVREDGLFLWISWVVRFGAPALLIPWGHVHRTERTGVLGRQVFEVRGGGVEVEILIPARLLEGAPID